MPNHAERLPTAELLKSFHENCGLNIQGLSDDLLILLNSVDLNCRTIDGIRLHLHEFHCDNDIHKPECSELLSEVFSDFAMSMYLFSAGLVVPARVLIRRALELCIAALYMWDLPHEYWGWKCHNEDLSFTKMISHLTSDGYLSYINNAQSEKRNAFTSSDAAAKLSRCYGDLSDTIHGKAIGLPALSPERYRPDDAQLKEQLHLTINVQNKLIFFWCARFNGLSKYVEKNFPRRLVPA